MKLNKIDLLHFRNFSQCSVRLHPNKNYFIGENAQGKTNFLEAVYFLSHGKSFRPTETSSLIQFTNQEPARLNAQFQHNKLGYQVKAQIDLLRRHFSVNQKKAYPSQLEVLFPVVLFSPESLSVIKESAEQRRNLVDELVMSHEPRQNKIMVEFTRALRSRNALLKDIAKNGLRDEQRLTLESLNQIYLVLATHVTKIRINALKNIWPEFETAANFVFGKSTAKLDFEYLISNEPVIDWDEQKIFAKMQNRMAELQQSEYGAGHSLVGPHKHDIKFLFDENDTRFYCSQGQQRALILALKIAQIVYHQRVHKKYPILLLDDVLSELDENKRSNLMKFLGEISAQVLITATELFGGSIAADMGEVFFVKNGAIEKLNGEEKLLDLN